MALFPDGEFKPLHPEAKSQPFIVPNQFIIHSAAVDIAGLHDYFSRPGVGVESHFFVKWSGHTKQYVDTSRSADANYLVNRRWDGARFVGAISAETEDDGRPDSQPWSPEQIEAIVRLGTWAIEAHEIPRRVCRSWTDPGIGYHSQFSQWSKYKKTCPGVVRVRQWNELIVPRLLDPSAAVVAASLPDDPYKDVIRVKNAQGLVANDPISGGEWLADEEGAVYALSGAPYLGGYNAWPEWGAGSHPRRCVGILPWVEARDVVGYKLIFDDLSVYKFNRDGRYVKH